MFRPATERIHYNNFRQYSTILVTIATTTTRQITTVRCVINYLANSPGIHAGRLLCGRSGQYWWMKTPVWFLLDSSEKETILLKFIDFDFTHTHKLSNIIFPDICTWDKEGTAGSGVGGESVSGEGRVKSSASELPEPPEFISSTYYVVNCSPQPCVQPGILWGEVCGQPQVVLTLSFDSFNFINSIIWTKTWTCFGSCSMLTGLRSKATTLCEDHFCSLLLATP